MRYKALPASVRSGVPDPVHPVSTHRPAGLRRARDLAATAGMMLVVVVAAIPFVGAGAASPSLAIKGEPVAGARVRVEGRNLPPRTRLRLAWDGAGLDEPRVATNKSGSFKVKLTIPADTPAGEHELSVLVGAARAGDDADDDDADDGDASEDARELAEGAVLATLTVEVVEAAPAIVRPPAAEPVARPAALPVAPSAPAPVPTTAPKAATVAAPTAAAPVRPTSGQVSVTATGSRGTTVTAAVPAGYILLSPPQIARLPMTGASWSAIKAKADVATVNPVLSNQDDNTDQIVLSKALVFVRTGNAAYRTGVVAALKKAIGTENGGRTLALGRNLPAYVIAADLIDLDRLDPVFDQATFRPWLRSLLTKSLDGKTLRSTHEQRPNNWGTHAGAARVAIAAYLGDPIEMAQAAKVFRGWTGDRAFYAGFKFGDLSWQCDPARPVAINPTGCTRDGHSLDGVLPEEQRRAGAYQWPAPKENYVWEALQGATLQAELLTRAGYPAWTWSNNAILRATRWLYLTNGFPAGGDDEWQPWLIDARYGTAFARARPARWGKNFGGTDWLYGS